MRSGVQRAVWVRVLVAIVLAVMIAFVQQSFAEEPLGVGKRAPKITAFTLEGELISLENLLRRDAVFLYFWKVDCQRCLDDLPKIKELHDNYKRKLRIVGVNPGIGETVTNVRDYQDEFDIRHDLVFDKHGEITRDYVITGIPVYIIINKRGRITYLSSSMLTVEEIESGWSKLGE